MNKNIPKFEIRKVIYYTDDYGWNEECAESFNINEEYPSEPDAYGVYKNVYDTVDKHYYQEHQEDFKTIEEAESWILKQEG